MHKAIPCPDGLRQAALPGRFQADCFAPPFSGRLLCPAVFRQTALPRRFQAGCFARPFSGRLLCPAVAGIARIPVLHIRVTKLENIYAAS